jgi:hypothetical protein
MSGHISISVAEVADRIAIRELVEAKYAATMHVVGQSTVLALTSDRGTGEAYCLAHHLTIEDEKRQLMIAALRYYDTFVRSMAHGCLRSACCMVDWITGNREWNASVWSFDRDDLCGHVVAHSSEVHRPEGLTDSEKTDPTTRVKNLSNRYFFGGT